MAILVLVAATLVLTGLGTVLVVRHAATQSAATQIREEANGVAAELGPLFNLLLRQTPTAAGTIRREHLLALVKAAGHYDTLSTIGLTPDGLVVGTLPSPLNAGMIPTDTLLNFETASGVVGREAYALIPLDLSAAQLRHLDPALPPEDTAVLVLTQPVQVVAGGIGWLLLVAAGCLAAATVVAYWLARRFSRPLAEAASTTERIAQGDLDAAMAVHPPPEVAALATSINTMTQRLREARDHERRFLLSVSHDLRTPLTSIKGYAEAIADGAATDPPGAAAVITEEAGRLERLVQDLLDLARLGAHRFSLQMGPVDAAALTRTVADRFRPQARAAGITLETEAAGALPVVADGDRLQQVLDNLLENAYVFARSRILVGAGPADGHAVLWVTDDGPGIRAEDLGQVFEPHYSSDRSTTRRNGTRTGLGLAIVAELATAMGGGVRADSPAEDGHGTRLTVWLPLSPAPPRAEALEPRPLAR